jgi:hypothetical protein
LPLGLPFLTDPYLSIEDNPMTMRSGIFRVLAMAVAGALHAAAAAADFTTVAPYIADDVTAVVTVDLSRFSATRVLEQMSRWNMVPDNHLEEATQQAAAYQRWHDELVKRGATRMSALVRTSEVLESGPTWVVETGGPEQAQPVLEWLKRGFGEAQQLGDVAKMFPREFAIDGSLVVGAVSQQRLTELRAARRAEPRADAMAALAAATDAEAAGVVFGDADGRRVVRELFPTMPVPFNEINGRLLADGIKWVGAAVTFAPELRVTFAIEAAGEESAKALSGAADKGLTILKGLALAAAIDPPSSLPAPGAQLVKAVDMLAPRVEGTRLSITFGDDENELALLHEIAGKPLQQAREAAHRRQRMDKFKQISLAMHNYAAAHNTLPPAASYSADGKPLLSWRVHVLPYLGEHELYKEFKLDEPWDSEHNKKLIARMPAAYADPDPAVRGALGEAGRTTFVGPAGEGLALHGREGRTIRAFSDGTSNTIALVEVTPDRAVVWTQPADWDVDKNDPLAGVRRNDRDVFSTGWADAHVTMLRNEVNPQSFYKALTIAGGETIDQDELR